MASREDADSMRSSSMLGWDFAMMQQFCGGRGHSHYFSHALKVHTGSPNLWWNGYLGLILMPFWGKKTFVFVSPGKVNGALSSKQKHKTQHPQTQIEHGSDFHKETDSRFPTNLCSRCLSQGPAIQTSFLLSNPLDLAGIFCIVKI